MALLWMQCRGLVRARDTRASTAIEAAALARCASVSTPATSSGRRSRVAGLTRFVADNIETFEASDSKLAECAFNRLVDIGNLYSRLLGYCSPISNRCSRTSQYSRRIWSNCWHK